MRHAAAGRDDVGILGDVLGRGVGAFDRLDVARQRVEARPGGVVEDHGVHFRTSGLGGEAGLAVGAQIAGFVLAVLELGVLPGCVAQFLPGEPAVFESVIPHLLDAVPRPGDVPVLFEREALAELEEDGVVGLALADARWPC